MEPLPCVVGLLAVLVAVVFVLHDSTDLDVAPQAAWALGLAFAGLCGLVVAVRRLRG